MLPSEWTIHVEPRIHATFSFTPESSGPFHYAAEFSDDFGVYQGDVLIASLQTREPLAVYDVPAGVKQCLHMFPSGALACERGEETVIVRDGRVTQQFGKGGVFAGRVMWYRNERWVEVDGGLEVAQRFNGEGFVATGTDTTGFGFVDRLGLVRFEVSASKLTAVKLVSPSAAPVSATMTRDGGAWWSEIGGALVCLNPLLPDAGQRCLGDSSTTRALVARGNNAWAANLDGDTLLAREDGTFLAAKLPQTHTFAAPFLATADLDGVSRDLTLVLPVDAGYVFETLGEQYTNGWVDEDVLLLVGAQKVTVVPR